MCETVVNRKYDAYNMIPILKYVNDQLVAWHYAWYDYQQQQQQQQ
jgi:hypothetical protein